MIVALLLLAQVSIRVTPEPLAVTKARFGDVRGMGAWRVAICAEQAASLPALRVEMAITDLALIDPESAATVIRGTPSARRRDRIIQGLMFAGIAAAGLTAGNYLQISGREAGMVALGLDLANRVRGRIEQGVVVLDPSRLLTGTIDLAAGECTSRAAFAGLVPRSRLRAYGYRITANTRRPMVAGISAVPP